jgi:hypothetical protein
VTVAVVDDVEGIVVGSIAWRVHLVFAHSFEAAEPGVGG